MVLFLASAFADRFSRKQVDQELKDELRDHLEQQIRSNFAKGMSTEEARYSALRAMGGVTQIEQQCRDARGHSIENDIFRIYAMDSVNCSAVQDFLLSQFCA